MFSKRRWMSLDAIFFQHRGIQSHTFASYALPCQTPFCQTTPLLSSVARQQNLTEYWREGSTCTAICPTSASDVVGQHNKIAVINFGSTLVVQSHMTDVSHVIPLSKNYVVRRKYIYNTYLTPMLSMRWEITGCFILRVCLFHSSCLSACLSVRPSAWKNSAPTGWILTKFYIWLFFKICWRNSSFIEIWQE